MDMLPTVLEAVGGAPMPGVDGISLLPLLVEGKPLPERDIYWEMDGQTAVRRGDMKLVLNGRLVEGEGPREAVYLSDLASDPGERNNLADEMPDLTEGMKKAALSWREALERNWDARFARNYSLT
jgi:arylsulfatase A-like enzyme